MWSRKVSHATACSSKSDVARLHALVCLVMTGNVAGDKPTGLQPRVQRVNIRRCPAKAGDEVLLGLGKDVI